MREFNWDEFKSHLVAVHYKNKAEENNFLKNAEKHKFANDVYRCDNLPDKDYYISVFTFSGFDGFNNSVMKAAEIDGYKILEWGDYMEFTKEDLRVGMLVGTSIGGGIVMPSSSELVVIYEDGNWSLINFSDVNKVYGYSNDPCFAMSYSSFHRDLLYERPTAKEMTVEEISKALGYDVKVVKG